LTNQQFDKILSSQVHYSHIITTIYLWFDKILSNWRNREAIWEIPMLNYRSGGACGTRTTSGTRRFSRWHASNFHVFTKTWIHSFL